MGRSLILALVLAAGTTIVASAQPVTPAETTGTVVAVDPSTGVIVLEDGRALQVTPVTIVTAGGRTVQIVEVKPGTRVTIRNGTTVRTVPGGATTGDLGSALPRDVDPYATSSGRIGTVEAP